jgi:hypothetical protein
MIIPVFEPATLAEYIKLGAPQAPRPSLCPKCRECESFWRHGSFERLAIEGMLEASVRIQRFLCHICGLAVSCLFAFLVPYRQATASLVAQAVTEYAGSPTTYRQTAEEMSPLESTSPPKPSHSQVFRWVQGVANKAERLLLQVQKELLLQGRADDVQNMIGVPCPNAHRAHSICKAVLLNRLAELLQFANLLVGENSNSMTALHSNFLSQVESLQVILSERVIRLANPQTMKHVVF